jgi:translocation and assembly module TamA
MMIGKGVLSLRLLFARYCFLQTCLLLIAMASPLCAQDDARKSTTPQDTIIPDDEFDKAVGDLNPLAVPAAQEGQTAETLSDAPVIDPAIDDALKPIATFDAEPPAEPTSEDGDTTTKKVRYEWRIEGIDSLAGVRARFDGLSVLDDGGGKADNGAMVAARLTEDQQLALNILSSEGYFDATVKGRLDQPAVEGGPLSVVLNVTPGPRYALGSITFDAKIVEPATLITDNFVPKTGDPIIADTILAAEANIALALPRTGYPFAKIGERDILLDGETQIGDYTLPVEIGPRSSFGWIVTQGTKVFEAGHIEVLKRYKTGDLYDSRKVDDLRAALVATGLLSTVSVEPVASEAIAPNGTHYADLLVRQEAGPTRTLSGSAGYSTGQGLRLEGSWTHRNLFPPEGSLAANAVLGTQEQGVGVTFHRANAGKRDRSVELGIDVLHAKYAAYEAFTGRLAGRISHDTTQIWQKRITYSYGFELIGTNEEDYDFLKGKRDRQTYAIVALPGQIGFDTSNSLLDPTKGFRVNVKFSPEASLGSGKQIYGRALVEGTVYYPVGDNIVLAARARAGAIAGIERGNLAPSRRYYGGGGGSVRGFGFQELGPRDPDNKPIGGRSMNEAAIEARYRFGNYGVAGFVDAGQVYESSVPRFDNWRFGVGIGARFYTNFGPLRLDVATPINRQSGESRISVYVSIGQAF